jgi:hypothetical protein
MRKLSSAEKTPYCLRIMRILSRKKSFGFGEKSGKKAEKSQSKKGGGKQINLTPPSVPPPCQGEGRGVR